MSATIDQLESAIAALEAQRALLGNATVDAALGPMRDKLALVRSQTRSQDQRLKAVSVLFADIVGSTAMSRELDPEDIHAILDGALARFSALIVARDGRVLQYAGDSLLAVFGADGAHENDAENAVHAGLAILAEAKLVAAQVKAEHGHDGFDVRVGISSGPVLLGGGVDEEGSIRGITVNTAARMEQTAPTGALRISHEAYRHVRGVFDVVEQPPIEVKGIGTPLRNYLVQRAKPRAFRIASRGIEGVESHMIGRDVELKRLTEAIDEVTEDCTLAVITVIGDAGIGKSRLIHEFSGWMELQTQRVWIFRGRADTHGELVPYGVVRDLFCWRFQIDDSDPLPEARRKLVTALEPAFGDGAGERAALIGHLIGLDFSGSPFISGIIGDPKQIRDRAFHAAAQYLRHMGERQSVVMLLEDLHWADEGSLDFVNHIAQTCRDVPMLILCAARPSLFERRPLWGSGQEQHERVELTPLNRRASRELANALLQKIAEPPAVLRELITAGAEGNPYYMEELTKMLIDDGVIVTGSDQWTVVPDRLASVNVPPTLVGVLQARVDALPVAEKLALQCASVVGHVFWDGATAVIEPKSIEELPGLMARELVHGRETTTFDGAHEFVFKHHLLQQVTYDSVLKRHRREQHRLVAEWLVAQSGERIADHYAAIAGHFEKAGDVGSATRYLQLAGEDAVKAYANEAALDHLGRALTLAPTDDHALRFGLLMCRVEVLYRIGARDRQLADCETLMELADTLDDDVRRARATAQLARHALSMAEYPKAALLGSRGVALAEKSGEPDAGLNAHLIWLGALRAMGDQDEALTQAERHLASAESLGNVQACLRVLNVMGGLSTDQGRYGVAREHYKRSLELSRQIGNRVAEANALASLGDAMRCFGLYDEAIELGEGAARIYREVGFTRFEGLTQMNIATALRLKGDATRALEYAMLGLEMVRETRNADLQAAGASVAGEVHFALGRLDEAAAFYHSAVEMFRQVRRDNMAIESLAGVARVAWAAGDRVAARTHVDDIVGHLDGGGTVEGTEDPMSIYLTCYRVMADTDIAKASEILAAGHALLEKRAALIDGPERDDFLTRVPSHRALREAFDGRVVRVAAAPTSVAGTASVF